MLTSKCQRQITSRQALSSDVVKLHASPAAGTAELASGLLCPSDRLRHGRNFEHLDATRVGAGVGRHQRSAQPKSRRLGQSPDARAAEMIGRLTAGMWSLQIGRAHV